MNEPEISPDADPALRGVMTDPKLNLTFAYAQEHSLLVDAISDLRAVLPTLAEPEPVDWNPSMESLAPACTGLRSSLRAMLDSVEATSDPLIVSALQQGNMLLRRLNRDRPL